MRLLHSVGLIFFLLWLSRNLVFRYFTYGFQEQHNLEFKVKKLESENESMRLQSIEMSQVCCKRTNFQEVVFFITAAMVRQSPKVLKKKTKIQLIWELLRSFRTVVDWLCFEFLAMETLLLKRYSEFKNKKAFRALMPKKRCRAFKSYLAPKEKKSSIFW